MRDAAAPRGSVSPIPWIREGEGEEVIAAIYAHQV